jgi:peptide deformylase
MVRPIRKIGDPVLRKKAAKVAKVTKEVQKLIDDMVETMRHARGQGLAAPQVGVSLRVAVVETVKPDAEGKQVKQLVSLINPEIVKASDDSWQHAEGCLSIPGWRGDVERPYQITVKALDRNGERVRFDADGMFARAIQHEVDHLDGVFYTDKLIAPDRIWQVDEDEPDDGDDA